MVITVRAVAVVVVVMVLLPAAASAGVVVVAVRTRRIVLNIIIITLISSFKIIRVTFVVVILVRVTLKASDWHRLVRGKL